MSNIFDLLDEEEKKNEEKIKAAAAETGIVVPMNSEEVKEVKVEVKKLNYAIWTVQGVDYKLKLTAQVINELESKFQKNLLNFIQDVAITEKLPTLTEMLLIIHAAFRKYHSEITYNKIFEIYDNYVDEGGTISLLFENIIMDIFEVSGFFTREQ